MDDDEASVRPLRRAEEGEAAAGEAEQLVGRHSDVIMAGGSPAVRCRVLTR
jgi:hypothetical protein